MNDTTRTAWGRDQTSWREEEETPQTGATQQSGFGAQSSCWLLSWKGSFKTLQTQRSQMLPGLRNHACHQAQAISLIAPLSSSLWAMTSLPVFSPSRLDIPTPSTWCSFFHPRFISHLLYEEQRIWQTRSLYSLEQMSTWKRQVTSKKIKSNILQTAISQYREKQETGQRGTL